MDLDTMMNTSHDELLYGNYDNRPIRPMDQDALNEALARLPILVDENEPIPTHSDANTSLRTRRQPNLAYSTRRKDLSSLSINQSVLNTSTTPNNKRKLAGCTPTTKFSKQFDSRQDLIQLKEENKDLEEIKATLQLEIVLLKKTHENEIEILKQEHQQEMDRLIQQHHLQIEQFNASLAEKEQLISQTNLELDNLRNDQTMLLLEKETLDKIVEEYQLIKDELNQKLNDNETTIKNLRDEIENLTKTKKPPLISKTLSTNNRIPSKDTSTDRSKPVNKSNPKVSIASVPTNSTKTISSLSKTTKLKTNSLVDEKKKATSIAKHINPKSKTISTK